MLAVESVLRGAARRRVACTYDEIAAAVRS
jgi:hypothetical protein